VFCLFCLLNEKEERPAVLEFMYGKHHAGLGTWSVQIEHLLETGGYTTVKIPWLQKISGHELLIFLSMSSMARECVMVT
jgi:hypothetical protein